MYAHPMSYAFRARFRMPGRARLSATGNEVSLSECEDVRLVAGPEEEPLNDAEWVFVIGRGYESEEMAEQAAARWRGYVERGFARASIPADFDAPTGVLTYVGEQICEEQTGERVLNETALNVFDEDPWPRFARVGPAGVVVGRNFAVVLGAIKAAADRDLCVPEQEALAYNLFSASFSQPQEDARFMMLMMAIETLINLQPRAPEVQAHVDNLISLTREADLPANERQSILGTLKWLYDESISQGGRRLAGKLGDQLYADESPERFFTSCYSIRSGLAHGHHPRPSVDGRVAALETFVADLLSAELLDAVDIHALA
jgi:hypothetical protein